MEPRYESLTPLSVLVVEPHTDGADSLADLLRLIGHRVTVARTGADALAATAADPPDVVLLEVRLPDLDGWQVAWRLREPGAEAKKPLVVAVTTCGTEADRRRSAEAGIDLHLVKPAEPMFLLGVLCRFARALASGSSTLGPPSSNGDTLRAPCCTSR